MHREKIKEPSLLCLEKMLCPKDLVMAIKKQTFKTDNANQLFSLEEGSCGIKALKSNGRINFRRGTTSQY